MAVTLRPAGREDCQAVYELICRLEDTRFPFDTFSTLYEEQLVSERHICLLCEREGSVVGVLNLRMEGQLHHCGRVAEVMELVVSPACRGEGIGSQLLTEACVLAREWGCVQIEVACNQLRKDTHRFYQREGMTGTHFKFSKPL